MRNSLGNRSGHDRTERAPNLSHVVGESLRRAIRAGELPPGSPIKEEEISARHRMSRTPVREAIQQLSKEGIIQVIRNRGAFVAIPSLEDMLSVLHLRALVDPEIARMVANSHNPAAIARLHADLAAMREAVASQDERGWTDADLRLHGTLVKACPNRILGDLAHQMRTRMQLGLASEAVRIPDVAARTEEQAAIVGAIASRNPIAAEAAVVDHLRSIRSALANAFP